MSIDVLIGILIPFVGTALGAACVFFLKNQIPALVQKGLLGFASGVMVAASVWALLIPAIEMSEDMGRMAFVPGAVGIAVGMAFLLLMDRLVPHLHLGAEKSEGLPAHLKKTTMLVLAVTLHNIPEGWQSVWHLPDICPGKEQLRLPGRRHLRWVSPFRISQRGR